MNVIERLAQAMRDRAEQTWEAAVAAAKRERLVDPVELAQTIASYGIAGCRWIYESLMEPEELPMDDMTEVGGLGFEESETGPGVMTLDEVIDRLRDLRASQPNMARSVPLAFLAPAGSLPALLRGVREIRVRATREAPTGPQDVAVVLELE